MLNVLSWSRRTNHLFRQDMVLIVRMVSFILIHLFLLVMWGLLLFWLLSFKAIHALHYYCVANTITAAACQALDGFSFSLAFAFLDKILYR